MLGETVQEPNNSFPLRMLLLIFILPVNNSATLNYFFLDVFTLFIYLLNVSSLSIFLSGELCTFNSFDFSYVNYLKDKVISTRHKLLNKKKGVSQKSRNNFSFILPSLSVTVRKKGDLNSSDARRALNIYLIMLAEFVKMAGYLFYVIVAALK